MTGDIDHAACTCGAVDLGVSAPPLFRVICHCTICQRFNDADFADVCVMRAGDVELSSAADVKFETYRPPPNVQRGRCPACDGPAVEIFRAPLFPDLVMIPTGNFKRPDVLPRPAAHLFYEHRVADAHDDLPRYKGYLPSQWAFMSRLFPALFRRR